MPRLISEYDQSLAAAVDWWNSHSIHDRRNLLILLCNKNLPVASYRGLNDSALEILRDLAALAVARIVIGSGASDEEIVL